MGLNTDSKIILSFYFSIIISLVLIFTVVDKVQDIVTKRYLQLAIGIFWAISGAYVSTYLPKLYKKSFWQLQRREQRVVLMAVIISALGIILIIRTLM